jgi:glycosyltransferase-like protein
MTSIGLFTYSTRPRGSVVHAASLAEALTELGHDVTLYALAKDGDAFYRPIRARLELLAAGAAPAETDRLIAQRIGEFVAGLRALAPKHDVFHAEDCLAANALLEFGASPVVRTVHHVEHFESQYLLECQRKSIERADLVLSVSAATRRDVNDEYELDAASVPNGVDVERFAAPRVQEIAQLRADFAVPDGAVVVLSVGGVEPRKNTVRALEAFGKVARERSDVHWFVAGGASIWDHDPYRTAFSELLSAMPAAVRRRVHLLGSVEEETLTALYQLADVLLFPSTQEGWGLAAMEALAARTALVVPRGEPFTEYVDDASAAFVDETSSDSIAATLRALVADPSRRVALADAGRVRVEAYTWRRSALEHLTHYRALLRDLAPVSRPTPVAAIAGELTDA